MGAASTPRLNWSFANVRLHPEHPPAGEVAAQSGASAARASGGSPLDTGTRGFFEARFGRDLGAVRIHEDASSEDSARGMRALAYTVGHDVFFRIGHFAPGTGEGRRLLAHELTHVVQQERAAAPLPSMSSSGALRKAAGESDAGDEHERHADAVAERVVSGGSAVSLLQQGLSLPRAPGVLRKEAPSTAERLPAPIPVLLGKDRFEATVEHREALGDHEAVVRLRYVGALRTDLAGNVLELRTSVAPRAFDVRQLPGVANELVLDLFSDHTTVLRVEDSIEFEPGAPGARRHAVNLRAAGRFAMSAKTFRVYDAGAKKTDARPFQAPVLFGQAGHTRMEPGGQLFHSAGERAVHGGNAYRDVEIGPYGDRFRITVDWGDERRPVLGIAPFYLGKPVGGRGAVLAPRGPLEDIQWLQEGPDSLELDLNGDGEADVRLNDHVEQPSDLRNTTPEGDRDHRFSLTGSAIPGGASFTVRYRHGHLEGGHRGESAADLVAAGAMVATSSMDTSALSGYRDRVEDFTDAFGMYRRRALDQGLLAKRTFDAWYALTADMQVLELQVPSGTVEGAVRDSAAARARTLLEALMEETRNHPKTPLGDNLLGNPYTGEVTAVSILSTATLPGPATQLEESLRAGRWSPAFNAFRELTTGLDRWVVDRLAKAGGRDIESLRGMAAMGAELRKLAGKNASRIPAVFVPSPKFRNEPGYTPGVPLELYYWREGDTFQMVDLTKPLRPFHDSTRVRGTAQENLQALMAELDNKQHFAEGRVYFDVPGITTGQVAITDALTWQDFFTWLGIGLAAVGTAVVTFGTGTVAVVGLSMLVGSALAGATAATIDLVEGARHGTLTTGTVVLDLAQVVGAFAGIGAMAAGRVLSVARASAAASAPLTGARWEAAAMLAQRAVIPLAATNVAADTVTLAVLTQDALVQLDAIDRSAAPVEARQNARLRLLGQLAVTGGLTALSLRGNVAEITAGRSIRVVDVAGEPVVVPEGTSFAGKAIARSVGALEAAPAAIRASAEARHLRTVRDAVGGTGGEALARLEALALARTAGRADATVVADGQGRVISGATKARTLPEFLEQADRANNAARAHGVSGEYVVELRPGTAPGSTEAVISVRARAASAAAGANLYLDVAQRTAAEAAQVTRLRMHAGATPFRMELLPEGLIRINGQIDIHPGRLAEISDGDLKHLMTATHALDAVGGDMDVLKNRDVSAWSVIRRFSSSDPEIKPTRVPERGYRLRFVHNQREAIDNLDKLMAELGTSRAEHAAFIQLAPSDVVRLYDLANAQGLNGADYLQTRATGYALAQNPIDARTFVEHYEYYRAEFAANGVAREEELASATGRAELSRGEVKRLRQQIEQEMADPDNPYVARPAAADAIRSQYDARVVQLNGRFGTGMITPRLSDLDAVRAIQQLPDVQFGSEAAAVYHARKHLGELAEAHQRLSVNSVQSYLDSAMLTIRSADPIKAAASRNTAQDGSSRSFAFKYDGRRAIVVVTAQGRVLLATYP